MLSSKLDIVFVLWLLALTGCCCAVCTAAFSSCFSYTLATCFHLFIFSPFQCFTAPLSVLPILHACSAPGCCVARMYLPCHLYHLSFLLPHPCICNGYAFGFCEFLCIQQLCIASCHCCSSSCMMVGYAAPYLTE